MKRICKLFSIILIIVLLCGCEITDYDGEVHSSMTTYPTIGELKGEWVYKNSTDYYSLGDGVWTLFDSTGNVISYGIYTYNADTGKLSLSSEGDTFTIFNVADKTEMHDSNENLLRRKE